MHIVADYLSLHPSSWGAYPNAQMGSAPANTNLINQMRLRPGLECASCRVTRNRSSPGMLIRGIDEV